MPIQIINSGVKLTPEPNTISTVVSRNETGVICRVSASLPTRRTRRFSHQGLVDGSDGVGDIDRQADGGDGGQASAGQASSPYDMTSVFGLMVQRTKAEELAAEEQSKRKIKSYAPQSSAKQPEQEKGSENPSGEPGTENAGEEAIPADVWIKRSRGSAHKRLPAHTTLTDRVRQGNDLVSARRAMDASLYPY
ncbi:unnamed protein product, partial [Ectocarpus sp. 4 AP-2014]